MVSGFNRDVVLFGPGDKGLYYAVKVGRTTGIHNEW